MRPVLKYGLAIIVIITAILLVVFSRPAPIQAPEIAKISEQKAVKQVDTARPVDYQYSRITFFNTWPVKASLAVPDYWEGLYRLKEQGNEAAFYYIGDNKEEKLMSIYIVKEDGVAGLGADSLLAGKKDGYLAFYRLFEPEKNPNIDENTKIKMFEEAKMVVDSLKLR